MKIKVPLVGVMLISIFLLFTYSSKAQIEFRPEVGAGFPSLFNVGVGVKNLKNVHKIHYGSFFGLLGQGDSERGTTSVVQIEGDYFFKEKCRGYVGWDMYVLFNREDATPVMGIHIGRENHIIDDALIFNFSFGLVGPNEDSGSSYISTPPILPSFDFSFIVPINTK